MASPLRKIDLLDLTAPRSAISEAESLNDRFCGIPVEEMLRTVLVENVLGRAAVVSSFGAESAVLLHLVGSINPNVPVLLVDTLRLFPETLAYRDTLIARLGLTDVRTLRPDPAAIAARDATELRWSYDPDGCCAIRKVAPLETALAGFDATITGRKGFQAATRAGLPRFEANGERIKLNPLADWSKADLDAYFLAHDLPHHPLEAQGYLSIGCAPCTSIVRPGEDPRAGRWRGWDKSECGLHTPVDPGEEPVF